MVLPHGVVDLWTLPDPDALLDAMTQEEFDRNDGRMPYWATLWPSALALADRVLADGAGLAGRRVLDLGSGLGLVGMAALARGGRVTFLDWEADAVALAVGSAWAAGFGGGVGAVEGVACDWRSPPPLAPFDRILGADVLYEERNAPGVAAFVAGHLAPGAEAWIVDPGRRHAERFPEVIEAAGLALVAREALPPAGEARTLTLWRIARRGA